MADAALTGSVHSFDISIGVDGPGTRFVAFLAGCPLRCLYCHSPDTWYRRSGLPTTVDELMTEIRRYERFIKVAGGGVTISGGEPCNNPPSRRRSCGVARTSDCTPPWTPAASSAAAPTRRC
ncbi:4Fe-4S cluster-binding domain-containing protein [Micromonospora sp. M12]